MSNSVDDQVMRHLNALQSELMQLRNEMRAKFEDLRHLLDKLEIGFIGVRLARGEGQCH